MVYPLVLDSQSDMIDSKVPVLCIHTQLIKSSTFTEPLSGYLSQEDGKFILKKQF